MPNWVLIFRLLSIGLLGGVAACTPSGQPSDAEQQAASAAAAQIRQALYVPAEAQLIAEHLRRNTDPEDYPGCVVVAYELAYESPQAFRKVLADYRITLLQQGWELHPNYSYDLDWTQKFRSTPQVAFRVSESPLRPDLLPVPTKSGFASAGVYYASLVYYFPSEEQCSG